MVNILILRLFLISLEGYVLPLCLHHALLIQLILQLLVLLE